MEGGTSGDVLEAMMGTTPDEDERVPLIVAKQVSDYPITQLKFSPYFREELVCMGTSTEVRPSGSQTHP